MSGIRSIALGLAVLLLLLGAGTVVAGTSEHYAIEWHVLDGGGQPSSSDSGNVIMTGSLGQSVIGRATSATYGLGSGYEYGVELEIDEEPTVITLVSLTAHASDEGVVVAWETGTEIDNAGFNLYRATAAEGPYVKINTVLIPAKGDPVSEATYSYLDIAAVGGIIYYYQLEDVDFFGVGTSHGPVDTSTGLMDGPAGDGTYLPLILKRGSVTD